MSDDTRWTAAEAALLGAAVVGAAFVLVRSPLSRRIVWTAAKFTLTSWLPAFAARELRAAWADSGDMLRRGADAPRP